MGRSGIHSGKIKALQYSLLNDAVILQVAGVPVDGASGTGAGVAGLGSIAVDTANGDLYVNGGAGTKIVPVWKLVTKAA